MSRAVKISFFIVALIKCVVHEFTLTILEVLQTCSPQLRLDKKYAINEKSTIFAQFCSNFEGLICPWDDKTLKFSAKLDKNSRFFINSTFLSKSRLG